MDFRRVETILIIAFLLVNVFLLSTFYSRSDMNYAASGSETINMVREMENQGIQLPEFTEEEHELPYLQADEHNLLAENASRLSDQTGNVNQDGSLYSSILSNPVALSGEEQLTEDDLARLDAFIQSGQVLFGDQYVLFQYRPNSQRIIYTQAVNGVPIADGTSSITLHMDSAGQVISYEQTFAGPMTAQGTTHPLITDRTAVELLFQNNEIPSGAKVARPVLTYYRTLALEDLSMYAPVWYVRIQTDSGVEEIRVDAINGSIITELPAPPTIREQREENETESSDTTDESATAAPNSFKIGFNE